ncbi:MAG: response regulator [Anaerolineae bacterium]|nr:response regulator [Anaerolineae bacterium]
MTSTKEDLQRKLLQTFQAESAEHIQKLNQTLLQLERETDGDARAKLLQDAFRTAHSLKGAARAVSLSDIEQLGHAMESVLQQARDTALPLDPNTCDVLYDALDTIQQHLDGQTIPVDPLVTRLTALVDSTPGTAHASLSAAITPITHTQSAAPSIVPSEETIRVTVRKLDDMMAQASELVVSEISAQQRLEDMHAIRDRIARWPKLWHEIKALMPRLTGTNGEKRLVEVLMKQHDFMQALLQDINSLDTTFGRDTLQLSMANTRLQDNIRRVRMVPFQTILPGFERAVRDAARSENKPISFEVYGGEVELDKRILEMLKDPLLHLLRNAVIHGIESSDTRAAAGKPPVGQVSISVRQRGNEIHIEVCDDGHGFDVEALRQASARNGSSPARSEADSDEIVTLAFQAGISTAQQITSMAGRGVGLDVVRQSIEELQGRIKVENNPGQSAAIQLIVPVSLAISRGLIIQVGKNRYVLPLLSVEKIEHLTETFTIEERLVLLTNGSPIQLVSLVDLLELPANQANNDETQNLLAVIIAVADQHLALLVNDVLAEQELAVKPLASPLKRVRNVAGTALLGSGEPVVVLNPADLIKSARGSRVPSPILPEPVVVTGPLARILVVDDSITTRTLEKNILEAAGYEILTAIDGTEALTLLEQQTVALIVSDVQMPHMDGIELTRRLRANERLKTLPLILVTSLESREDRERGMLAGADAYIVKRGFDQADLLATIERLL